MIRVALSQCLLQPEGVGAPPGAGIPHPLPPGAELKVRRPRRSHLDLASQGRSMDDRKVPHPVPAETSLYSRGKCDKEVGIGKGGTSREREGNPFF